jgi:hypothetical protein
VVINGESELDPKKDEEENEESDEEIERMLCINSAEDFAVVDYIIKSTYCRTVSSCCLKETDYFPPRCGSSPLKMGDSSPLKHIRQV